MRFPKFKNIWKNILSFLTVIALLLAIFPVRDCYLRRKSEKKSVDDLVKGEGSFILRTEYALCEAIRLNKFCPIELLPQGPINFENFPHENAADQIRDISARTEIFSKECNNYDALEKEAILIDLYKKVRALRTTPRESLAQLRPGHSLLDDAENCFQKINTKLTP